MNSARTSSFSWGFLSALAAIPAFVLWMELLLFFYRGVQTSGGSQRWLQAVGFFLSLLPVLALIVYRWRLVFDFFRSVKVGVVNLTFVGLSAILGVLFHQEDPNFPIPRAGIQELGHWQSGDQPWSAEARSAYRNYLDFRAAHAYFTYQLLHGLFFHSLPGVAEECRVDRGQIDQSLANLQSNIEPVRERYGEEFSVALAAQSATGLRVRQEKGEIAAFEGQWDDAWWTLFTWADRLDLIRVYKSDWFAALWVILFGGVLSNTFRGGWRRLLRPKKWGFVLTHAGVMLVVIGGFWGRLTEKRGILQTHIGEVHDRFRLYSGPAHPFLPPRLLGLGVPSAEQTPFLVKLDSFRADHFEVLDVIYAVEDEEGRYQPEFEVEKPPKHRVYPGQRLYYDYGPGSSEHLPEPRKDQRVPYLRIDVEEYLPQAEVHYAIRPRQPDDPWAVPMARLAVTGGSGAIEQEMLLVHHFEVPLFHAESGARILYRFVENEEQLQGELLAPVEERYGVLRQVRAGMSEAQPIDVLPGRRFTAEAGGRRYEVEILDAVPQLRLRRNAAGELVHEGLDQPLDRVEPSMPAVQLRIQGGDGESETRWILQQDFHEQQGRFPELQFEFRWDAWRAPAARRWLLLQLPDQSCYLANPGQPASRTPLQPGDSFPLDAGHAALLLEAYTEGVPEPAPEPVRGADFFHPAAGAVRLRAYTPDFPEGRSFVLSAENEGDWQDVRYRGPDGRPRIALLRFRQDFDDLPFEWRSKLTMYELSDEGQPVPVRSGEIRVNDYLFHEGYRFFQTDARADDPTYSGIGVVYDPGIETVLLGLCMVAIGTVVVFLINPLVTRKHRGA